MPRSFPLSLTRLVLTPTPLPSPHARSAPDHHDAADRHVRRLLLRKARHDGHSADQEHFLPPQLLSNVHQPVRASLRRRPPPPSRGPSAPPLRCFSRLFSSPRPLPLTRPAANPRSGTIKIEAADETDSVLKMSFFGAKKVFKELRVLWNQVKMGTVVE